MFFTTIFKKLELGGYIHTHRAKTAGILTKIGLSITLGSIGAFRMLPLSLPNFAQ